MKALPATGDVLAWTGSTVYHPESLQSVLTASDWPGVLQPRRPTQRLLDVLNPETKTVRPGLSLVLEQPLLPVHWFGCQVFVARVMRDLPDADSMPQHGAAEEHRVVLKLMYFDARRHGQNVDLDGFDFVAAPPIVKFAKSEADCYAALEKCQGSLVPYCYGFYKVSLLRRFYNGVRAGLLSHSANMDCRSSWPMDITASLKSWSMFTVSRLIALPSHCV